MTDEDIRRELKVRFPDRALRIENGNVGIAGTAVSVRIDREAVERAPWSEIARLAEEIRRGLG